MMMRRSQRTIVRALLVSWAITTAGAARATASAPASGADVERGDAAGPVTAIESAAAASSTGECPPQLSCGTGCTATFAAGFCSTTIEWQVQLGIGGIQIGPAFKIECYYCECWYVMPGTNGSLFKRTMDFGCGASFPGLELQ